MSNNVLVPCTQNGTPEEEYYDTGSSMYAAYYYMNTFANDANDTIIISTVSFWLAWQKISVPGPDGPVYLKDVLLNKATLGVKVILLYPPSLWDSKGANPFYLRQEDKNFIQQLNQTGNLIIVKYQGRCGICNHLKAFDVISGTQNFASIYYGSSNFSYSGHEEVGLYVTGDFNNNIVKRSILARCEFLKTGGFVSSDSAELNARLQYLTSLAGQLNDTFSSEDGFKYYDVSDGTSTNLFANESMVCNFPSRDESNNNSYKRRPIGENALKPVSGKYAISISPEYKVTQTGDKFAKEILMIIYLIKTAVKYVKISVMETYLDDNSGQSGMPITKLLKQTIRDAVTRGVHVLILTNCKISWNQRVKSCETMSFRGLTNPPLGSGTIQVRYYKDYSALHTKMYLSDKNVIISSQHPSQGFLTAIAGSSIMLSDVNVRIFYDNYFNLLWSHSITYKIPMFNIYPRVNNNSSDLMAASLLAQSNPANINWFQNGANLFLCPEEDKTPFMSSCCSTSEPAKGQYGYHEKSEVLYDVIFTDPYCVSGLDKQGFYGWWYNEIVKAKSFIYIASSPVSNLGSWTAWSTTYTATNPSASPQLINYGMINNSIYQAYVDALSRGVKIYLYGSYNTSNKWSYGPDTLAALVTDLVSSGAGVIGVNIFYIGTLIFWHEKLFATENAIYIGSQNALMPDSFEAGFAFYNTLSSKILNPMYFEALKRLMQYIGSVDDIESGYKQLEYNENNIDSNKLTWRNKSKKVTNKDTQSFVAVSPGNDGNGSAFSTNMFANGMMGDDATSEYKAIKRVLENASGSVVKIATYDFGEYVFNYNKKQVDEATHFPELTEMITDVTAKGTKVIILVPLQGISSRLNSREKPTNYPQLRTSLASFATNPSIDLYIIDDNCPQPAGQQAYWLTRKCHMIHSKFVLSDKAVYNSSANFSPMYLEDSVRNSGIYVENNETVLKMFSDFFDTMKDKHSDCINLITSETDLDSFLLNCKEEKPFQTYDPNCYVPPDPIPDPVPDSETKSKISFFIVTSVIAIILILFFIFLE